MRQIQIDRLLEVGIALTREKDGNRLLELILTAAMDITSCDGGTLYIKTRDSLAFKLMITKSNGTLLGGRYGPITLPPVPLSRKNVCACCVLDGVHINVPDVYQSNGFDFSGPRNYDSLTGYRTISMLVVPMEDDQGHIIGVLQLINALGQDGAIIPFEPTFEQAIQSLASQAAISLANMNYAVAMRDLLDSLVRVMSTAIDARSPYNANHTRNMVRYGEHFIDWVNEAGEGWTFSPAEKQQFLMGVWLHDVGKLTTPLEIMDKDTRLGGRLDVVLNRFRVIALLARIALLDGTCSAEEFARQQQALEDACALVLYANKPGILPEETFAQIAALAAKTFRDESGALCPWLTAGELESLSIRRGTLTAHERQIMQSHVTMTAKMLAEVKSSSGYTQMPDWAGAHHEFLNGTGYPDGLTAESIQRETRLLTILDVFDALTAQDRPYRPPMPMEEALSILSDMGKDGQLDQSILALFVKSCAWRETK